MRFIKVLCVLITPSVLLSAVLTPASAEEQPYDIIYTYSDRADMDAFGSELSIHEVRARTATPWDEQEGYALRTGGELKWNRFEPKKSALDELDLYGFRIPIDAQIVASENAMFVANVTPALLTDFKGVDLDDVQFFGSGAIHYDLNPEVTLVGGAAYGQEFGEAETYPVVGIHWQPIDELDVNLVYPSPRIFYQYSSELAVFVNAEPKGDEWNARDSGVDFNLTYESYYVGGGIEYLMESGSWFFLAVGKTMDRSIEAGPGFSSDIDDEYYAQVGVVVR